jgi:hypothetical protein
MIPVPTGVRVWLATGHTDMRRGFASLSLQVQEVLRRDPLSGHLFCFRGRRGDLLKVIWHDGQGACLRSVWRKAVFYGRARLTASLRSRPPSLAICCLESTGAIPRKPSVRLRSGEGFSLKIQTNMIHLRDEASPRPPSFRSGRRSHDDPRRAREGRGRGGERGGADRPSQAGD